MESYNNKIVIRNIWRKGEWEYEKEEGFVGEESARKDYDKVEEEWIGEKEFGGIREKEGRIAERKTSYIHPLNIYRLII